MSRSAYASDCAAYNLRVTTNEPKQAEKSVTEFLPPYAVILHNDDVNEMAFVAQALLNSVPELGQEDAVRIMLVAHNGATGRPWSSYAHWNGPSCTATASGRIRSGAPSRRLEGSVAVGHSGQRAGVKGTPFCQNVFVPPTRPSFLQKEPDQTAFPLVVPDLIRNPGEQGHANAEVTSLPARARGANDYRAWASGPHFHDWRRRRQPARMIATKTN